MKTIYDELAEIIILTKGLQEQCKDLQESVYSLNNKYIQEQDLIDLQKAELRDNNFK